MLVCCVSMWLLGCFGWFIGLCYVVARFRHCYVVSGM